jgi:phenylalanyl-tRNA synthetase beta subunit
VEEEGEEELAPAVQDPVEEGGGARRGPRVVPTAVTVRSPAKVYPSFSKWQRIIGVRCSQSALNSITSRLMCAYGTDQIGVVVSRVCPLL